MRSLKFESESRAYKTKPIRQGSEGSSRRRSQARDQDGSGAILRVLRVSVVRIRAKQSQLEKSLKREV